MPHKVFDGMPDDDGCLFHYNAVIGCARRGWFNKALSLFREMTKASVEPALLAALSVCAPLGDLTLGKWIHSYVNKKFHGRNQEIGVHLHDALIHTYASKLWRDSRSI